VTRRTLIVERNKDDVIARVARDARRHLVEVLTQHESAHVALTGGSVGIGVLAYLGATDAAVHTEEQVDWSRVHLWWGDERWVPAGHEDRNDAQAESVFVRALGFTGEHVHRMPASDSGQSLDEAAKAYATELHTLLPEGRQCFDLVFLGIGPDAHVASLFPHREAEAESLASVIAVRNSPKPPAERLSLTLQKLNSASHVWLMTAGHDKADAIRLTLGISNVAIAPASAVSGLGETRVYCDQSASSSPSPSMG
jgi:6-phosphogluconolactonase